MGNRYMPDLFGLSILISAFYMLLKTDSKGIIIGYLLFLSFIIYFLFSCFKIWIIKKDYLILFGSFYILTFFIPLLPGGSIFSTFNGTLFWLIFG